MTDDAVDVDPANGTEAVIDSDDAVDVDPANGTEAVIDSGLSGGGVGDIPAAEPEPGMPPGETSAAGPPVYTAPQKLTEVARQVTSRPSDDPKVSTFLAFLSSGFGRKLVVNPALALLPPFDQPDEWDAWLALLAGCALELVSDGVEVDVGACRVNAQALLSSLFDEAA